MDIVDLFSQDYLMPAEPYGWTYDDYGKPIPVAEQQQVIKDMHAWVKAGMTHRKIVSQLTARGSKPPQGGRWTTDIVKHLLERHKPGVAPKEIDSGRAQARRYRKSAIIYMDANGNVVELRKPGNTE